MSDDRPSTDSKKVSDPSDEPLPDLEPVMVVMSFRTEQAATLVDILARYVVLSRGQPGCRNIDLTASMTEPGRFVIVEKWDSTEDQRTHFDSDEMVSMAQAAVPLLSAEPDIDLFEGV
ncbi:MAG: antibiotic biosynthesis monooxygenase family protein, partial [Actinomycetota bacterium]